MLGVLGKSRGIMIAFVNIGDNFVNLRTMLFKSQRFRIRRCRAEAGESVMRHALILRDNYNIQ